MIGVLFLLETLLRGAETLSRALLPTLFLVLFLVLAAAPFGLPGQAEAALAVLLDSVFFWSVFRPAAIPALALLGLGLLADLLFDAPLGLTALALLAESALARRLRGKLVRQAFPLLWLAAAGGALTALALFWLGSDLAARALLPPGPLLLAALLAAGLFPPLLRLLRPLHERLG
jgi:rod shape-determining protein MreD